MIKDLGNSREADVNGEPRVRFAWSRGRPSWTCGWRRTGPGRCALAGEVGDGYILQLADPDIAAWMIWAPSARRRGGRPGPGPGGAEVLRRHAGLRGRRPAAACATRCGGSAGTWSATMWRRSWRGPGPRRPRAAGRRIPAALTDYIKGREGYKHAEHRPGRRHPHRVRARRRGGPVLPGGYPGRSTSPSSRELRGPRLRPVRDLPAARRRAGDPAGPTARRSSPPCRAEPGRNRVTGAACLTSVGTGRPAGQDGCRPCPEQCHLLETGGACRRNRWRLCWPPAEARELG